MHAEVFAFRNGLQHLQEDFFLLSELGVFPMAVLVMVLQREHDVEFLGDRQHCFNAGFGIFDALLDGNFRISLAG